MELLTYTEAAELTGLTNKTLQRHVKRGILQAVETPVGKRIPREALEPYMGLRRDSQGQGDEETSEDSEDVHGQVNEGSENPVEVIKDQARTEVSSLGAAGSTSPFESSMIPLAAHLAALDLAKTQLEYLQRQAEESQRIAMQAERAKYSLEAQLSQYQRVLAESAESLAEERAMRLAAEAKALKVLESPRSDLPSPAIPESAPIVVDTPTKRRGWGSRLKGWLLGDKAG